ncbi:MAG: hypothetical protein U0414_08240 [Polyangiaceae bacterium]
MTEPAPPTKKSSPSPLARAVDQGLVARPLSPIRKIALPLGVAAALALAGGGTLAYALAGSSTKTSSDSRDTDPRDDRSPNRPARGSNGGDLIGDLLNSVRDFVSPEPHVVLQAGPHVDSPTPVTAPSFISPDPEPQQLAGKVSAPSTGAPIVTTPPPPTGTPILPKPNAPQVRGEVAAPRNPHHL